MAPRTRVLETRLLIQDGGGRQLFPLNQPSLTLGRSAACDVTLTDPRVSRFHARLEAGPQGWMLLDLGSQNGILLNGRAIKRARVRAGDVIRLGGVQMILEQEAPDAAPESESSTPTPLQTREKRLSPLLQERESIARLRGILRTLSSAPSDSGILRLILDAAVRLTSSERGFLIQTGKQGMEFAAARNLKQEDLLRPEFQLSWSIAIDVGTRGESVLLVNAEQDPRFQSRESVSLLGLRSVLCVPIHGTSGILGVVYIDNPLRSGAYGEADQELLEMLADQAGIALNKRALLRALEEQTREVKALNERLRAQVAEKDVALRSMREASGEVEPGYRDFSILLGGSVQMDELRHLLRKVAATDFPVLIQGESGTGKEMVARCIHGASHRSQHPFVSLNCAALPESLLESELFGHERGAFTGADQKSPGLFRTADGGSLFLDEVSEMSPAMQSRLLRVLQDGEVRPVGGGRPIAVDVRVIAASNRVLGPLMEEGRFRKDLYFRLKVLTVAVPPLRQRRGDIPDFLKWFFHKHGQGHLPPIDPEALEALLAYPWPGNVRELENEVKRLVVLADGRVQVGSLSPHILEAGQMLVGGDSSFQDLGALVVSIEKREIKKALSRTGGNKTRAAALLGISRFTLQRKLEKFEELAREPSSPVAQEIPGKFKEERRDP